MQKERKTRHPINTEFSDENLVFFFGKKFPSHSGIKLYFYCVVHLIYFVYLHSTVFLPSILKIRLMSLSCGESWLLCWCCFFLLCFKRENKHMCERPSVADSSFDFVSSRRRSSLQSRIAFQWLCWSVFSSKPRTNRFVWLIFLIILFSFFWTLCACPNLQFVSVAKCCRMIQLLWVHWSFSFLFEIFWMVVAHDKNRLRFLTIQKDKKKQWTPRTWKIFANAEISAFRRIQMI